MSKSYNRLGICISAGFTSERLNACFGTGGLLGYNTHVIMSSSRNYFLCGEDFTTNRALNTFSKTGFRTGRSLCRINYFSVAKSINVRINVRVATLITSVSSITLCRTCRRGYYRCIVVTKRIAFGCATYRTSFGSGAGCCNPLMVSVGISGNGVRLIASIHRSVEGCEIAVGSFSSNVITYCIAIGLIIGVVMIGNLTQFLRSLILPSCIIY